MSNPTLKTVPLDIAGQKFELAFTFRALADAKKELGINFLKGIDVDTLTPDGVAKLLYIAASPQDPGLTQDKIDALPINISSMGDAIGAILKAWLGDNPPKADADPNEKPPES